MSLDRVLNQTVGDLKQAKVLTDMKDNRPDWLKAAAYEMNFARKELGEIQVLQKRVNERMVVALKWLSRLQ